MLRKTFSEGLSTKGKLNAQNKGYLAGLLQALDEGFSIFQKATEKLMEEVSKMKDEVSQADLEVLQKIHREYSAHLEAFKHAAFKEASAMLKMRGPCSEGISWIILCLRYVVMDVCGKRQHVGARGGKEGLVGPEEGHPLLGLK